MASSSPRFTWCACRKHKIPTKDTHELCMHCLGIQHAKEAVLEYGKCPHCAKMDWSTCINRLTKVQEVMHRENQQRKHEAAQSGAQPKPETTSAPVTEAKPVQDAVCSTQPAPAPVPVTPGPASSTMPVMFTILSPPPAAAEMNASVVKGPFMSHVAIQQSADSTPSLTYQSSHPLSTGSHKRKRLSKCHSRCLKHSSRSHGHWRRCSSSSSSSPFWSSSDSSCASALREKRRRREARRSQKPKELHERLLQVVEQKLEAQQQAMQIQWAMMERRLEALEKRDVEAPGSSAAGCRVANAPQPSTSSQGEEQRDWSGSTSDAVVTGSVPLNSVKQEEEASSVLLASKLEAAAEAERVGESSRREGHAVSKQDLLSAKELQSLIARAAKYLGVSFPKTSTSPPDPTMAPEFEELVQSTWPNPASSKPFREICPEMYRLSESQAPAYDRMPQINGFMSAIFQAVKPTDNKDKQDVPADRWRLTETLTEGTYQTAGMLAKTANYLRYLSDYQKRLLVEITTDHPAQRFMTVLNELKLIGQFAHQLSCHQAELSGRAMAASVAIRRQVWMAKTSYTDALKATVADLPFVVSQSVGVTSGGSTSGDTLYKQEQ